MADLGSILRAAPIGLLMLVGSYFAAKRRRSGAERSMKEFPTLATKLGLSHRPGGEGRIGTLSGEHAGHRVFVDPEDRPRIVVYSVSAPALVLRTYEHEKRVPVGMIGVATKARVINRLFKDCYASEAVAAAIADREPSLEKLMRPFSVRLPRTVTHLSITAERLECGLDFGRPSHVPPDVVEELLPAAVALMRLVESLDAPPES